FAMAPSVLSLVSQSANAAAICPTSVGTGMAGVIVIDLSGGGNIPGSNVMVGGMGGQLDFLPNYSSLGLPPDFHPSLAGQINSEMGLVFHTDSGMLRGIQSVTQSATRGNCEGMIFCTSTDDDTGNNQTNPLYWLNKAGARGSLNQLAGTRQTESGGNTSSPAESVNPSIQPVKIDSPQDATNLVSTGSLGGFFANSSSSKIEKLLNTVSRISEKKLENLSRRSLPEQIKVLVQCGFQKTSDQVKNFVPDLLNPTLDPLVNAVFPQIATDGNQRKTATIAKMVLDGFIGAATIEMGGYDYHTGDRQAGELRDLEAGQVIGRILELAARKQKDIVIIVLTDGGVAANDVVDNTLNGRGKFSWSGDSGQRSSAFMMVYKKDGKPQIRTAGKRQIGHFRPSTGSVENTAMLTSNSVVNLSKAMVANYLALHGKEGQLEAVVGDDPFRSNLDKYLVFNKLR
ncbi:MAG: general secretion pathway protein GspF, partial [Bdellovibrionales bacterium]|nr:general secretion pathway protein GspF [Bdellovibrionales bacterium]